MARFWISFIVLLVSAAVVIAPAVAGNKGKAGSKGKPNIVLFGQGSANDRGQGNNQGRGNANNGGRDIGLGNARSGVPNGILNGGTGLPPGGSKGKPNIVLFGQGSANDRGQGNNQGRGNANNGGRDIGLGNARSGVPNGILSGGTGLPPGLAKKGQLPPGLAKRDQLPPGLAKGHAVPPGLAKRDQLPPGLSQ